MGLGWRARSFSCRQKDLDENGRAVGRLGGVLSASALGVFLPNIPRPASSPRPLKEPVAVLHGGQEPVWAHSQGDRGGR